MDLKEQIKSKVTITDVVGLYVNLKPAGKYLKALCPFHTEKTPSFYVSPEKESFSCYGCNKFGDMFTFIQQIENIGFFESCNFLIDKFNIPVDRKQFKDNSKKDHYVKINEIALKYFRSTLEESEEGKGAREYIRKRGITHKTEEMFNLGYAENKWDGLYNYLRKESCNIEKAIELGLLVKGSNNRIYDRFRGRIIFPIHSESGVPIAFGGRTIFDDPSKYLNSPDTPLYKKSNHLYGFYQSKKAIREKKSVILVEGYFDAVSLFQNGVENIVASLGTALTDNQIYLLKRFSEHIYIFYDSDRAGVDAAVRGIEKMFEQNINPGIIMQQDVKDPDDFIREKGLKAFNQLVENSVDGFKFLLHQLSEKHDLQIPEQKNDAIRDMMGYLDKLGEPIIRDEYLRMAADFFQVDELRLRDRNSKNSRSSVTGGNNKRLEITPAERILLESLLAMPSFIGEVKPLISRELLSVLSSGNIIRLLMEQTGGGTWNTDDLNRVSERMSPSERAEFFDVCEKARAIDPDSNTISERIESSILTLQDILNKRDSRKIGQDIKRAQRENDNERIMQLIKEKNEYIKMKYNKQSIPEDRRSR